jgi:hypothetical protein
MQPDKVVKMEMAYEEADRFFRVYDIFDLIESKTRVEDYVLLFGFYEDAGRIAGRGIVPTIRPEKYDFHGYYYNRKAPSLQHAGTLELRRAF